MFEQERGKEGLEKVRLLSLVLQQDLEHSNLISKTVCRTGKGTTLIIKALLVTSCVSVDAYCKDDFLLFPIIYF